MKKTVLFFVTAIFFFSACKKECIQPVIPVTPVDSTVHIIDTTDWVPNSTDSVWISNISSESKIISVSSNLDDTNGVHYYKGIEFDIEFDLSSKREITFSLDSEHFPTLVSYQAQDFQKLVLITRTTSNAISDTLGLHLIGSERIKIRVIISTPTVTPESYIAVLMQNFVFKSTTTQKQGSCWLGLKTSDVMF